MIKLISLTLPNIQYSVYSTYFAWTWNNIGFMDFFTSSIGLISLDYYSSIGPFVILS